MSEKIEELIAKYGICEYRIVDTSEIIFSKNVRLLAEQEVEENGQSSWSMPPAVGTYEECRGRCKKYENALLFSTIYPVEDIANIEEWAKAGVEHNQITLQMAKELDGDCLPLGIRCRRCKECGWPSEECRHKESLLHSTESYGIHIMETMAKQDIIGFYDSKTVVCFGVILLHNNERNGFDK